MAAKRSSAKSIKRNAKRRSTFKLVWRFATLRIVVTPDYLSAGTTHLELTVVAPKGAPVPLTETGYRSHFIGTDELAAAGGPCTFITHWLDREGQSRLWRETEFRWRQGDLFPR